MGCIAQPFKVCSFIGLWEKEDQNLPSGFCVNFPWIKASKAQNIYSLLQNKANKQKVKTSRPEHPP